MEMPRTVILECSVSRESRECWDNDLRKHMAPVMQLDGLCDYAKGNTRVCNPRCPRGDLNLLEPDHPINEVILWSSTTIQDQGSSGNGKA
ncbi:hypothetical protein K443DRAFT_684041 [Laccaria amethystina LaAM-08-1]|uniref:Uncharacterized protein n=1 Tax=Laccaria amethystina LaAM-08-1 TaxID=1095629 RepID=A0A0C9WYQ3_9AGAR|nr:hypothetical protein K443DRAFT_684041 [Laccaria amethystina LaAM-08-1]